MLAARILRGDSPAQLHRWALQQTPKFLKQLIHSLAPSTNPNAAIGNQFSQSATQICGGHQRGGVDAGGLLASSGQFGQFSFDSLERSRVTLPGGELDGRRQTIVDGEHRALFMAIFLSAERGYLTMLQRCGGRNWMQFECTGQPCAFQFVQFGHSIGECARQPAPRSIALECAEAGNQLRPGIAAIDGIEGAADHGKGPERSDAVAFGRHAPFGKNPKGLQANMPSSNFASPFSCSWNHWTPGICILRHWTRME